MNEQRMQLETRCYQASKAVHQLFYVKLQKKMTLTKVRKNCSSVVMPTPCCQHAANKCRHWHRHNCRRWSTTPLRPTRSSVTARRCRIAST